MSKLQAAQVWYENTAAPTAMLQHQFVFDAANLLKTETTQIDATSLTLELY